MSRLRVRPLIGRRSWRSLSELRDWSRSSPLTVSLPACGARIVPPRADRVAPAPVAQAGRRPRRCRRSPTTRRAGRRQCRRGGAGRRARRSPRSASTAARAAQGAGRVPAELPRLMRRTDQSGLTRGADWQPACAAAQTRDGDAQRLLRQQFRSGAGRRRQGVRDRLLRCPRSPARAIARAGLRRADLWPPDRPDRRRSRQILRRAEGQDDPRPRRGQELRALLRPRRRSRTAR